MPEENNIEQAGPQGAAILLMALGETDAAEVMRYIEPDEVQAIGEAINAMEPVSQSDIGRALVQFVEDVKDQSSLGVGPGDYFQNMLVRSLGHEKAGSMLARMSAEGQSANLDSLKWMSAGTVAGFIGEEHPQVIAAVLSCLRSGHAADVLALLPADLHADIMVRVTELDTIHPDALKELDEIISRRFQENPGNMISNIGGVKVGADILNSVKKEMGEEILTQMDERQPGIKEKISEKMFVFDNLLSADDRGLQGLLRDVPNDQLVLALKSAGQALQEKIFNNLSKNAANMMRDDLEAMGPVKLADVEDAQKKILALANQFAEEGKLILGGNSDDFV
ncbi:flagellar motor switch protein FliG [Chromatiales bacterium (ex Bugula neritina AB1)]|nr:flagellar motor switch protein FliG [Chromatiales bacterium (ex Bugula neritina AB1)]